MQHLRRLLVPAVAISGFAGLVNAAGTNFIDSYAVHLGQIVPGHTTYQIRLDAVGLGGLAGIGQFSDIAMPLLYQGALLWNASGAPFTQNDFDLGPGSLPGDSWLTLGGYDAGSNGVQWTPEYVAQAQANPPGERFIVKGTQWGGLDDEGYFTLPAFVSDSGEGILIAQFTVEGVYSPSEKALPFWFSGVAGFVTGTLPAETYQFSVSGPPIPAPAALALLGGLFWSGGQRRR